MDVNPPQENQGDEAWATDARRDLQALVAEVRRVYVGATPAPEWMAMALVAGGHVLLEGVPGVAKTTLVKAFSVAAGCGFRRIQFTPDLLPSDVTGTTVYSPKDGQFSLRLGPVFTQVLLADEINRAPARTQSALLEAMEEGQVTIEGATEPLPQPFLVLATQNPVEQTGTFPLPEAQVDRFLFRVVLGYPTEEEEVTMLHRFSSATPPVSTPERPATAGPARTALPLHQVLSPERALELQHLAARVHVGDAVRAYVVRLARHTRSQPGVYLGVSPRGSLSLLRAARARALFEGRAYTVPDDVKAVAVAAMAHRLVVTPQADLEGVEAHQLVSQALEDVAVRQP